MTKSPRDSDWLEPPQWWKKVRPLRWLAGLVVLLLLYSWLGPDDEPAPPAGNVVAAMPTAAPLSTPTAAATEAAVTAAPATAATIGPRPTLAPTDAPTPTPTPTPTATATPTATPTALPTATAASAAAPATEDAPAKSAGEDASEDFIYEKDESDPGSPEQSELDEFTAVADDPVRLIGTFRSYASVDAVVFELERAGFLPMTETSNAKSRTDVPPRDLTTVTVSQFRHWNVTGKLILLFFNDRLYQSEFEPDDPTTYVKAQRRELPQVKSEKSGRAVWVGGNLRIASSLDLAVSDVGQKLKTRPFLLWQDRRLVRQRDEWDRRFAVAATGKKK
ncbi:MAG TPA: hypothetical protein VGE51_06255 [Fontimonas sp.]